MKVSDHLDENTKKEMYKRTRKSHGKKPPPKKEDKISFKDLERMMGKYDKPLYKSNGKWK